MTTDATTDLLQRIEAYLDAVPRSAAEAEQVGKFTLFRPLGPWPYYARPMLGLIEQISASDVDVVRERQRELRLPENIEWMVQTTPSLGAAARKSGLTVHEYPMLALEGGRGVRVDPPAGVDIRAVDADDEDFVRAHAVASVAFRAAGTQIGTEGVAERDERATATKPEVAEFMRRRVRDGLSIYYAAFDESGPIAVGTHQPVGDITEIVGVGTLPSARRRGIAAALVAALLEDALTRGVTTAFMGADSDDVARIYERAGFRRIGSVAAAEAPAAAPGG